jgi:FkbM family methyltransferase
MFGMLGKIGVVVTRKRNIDPEERMKVALSRELVDTDLFVDIGANSGQTYQKVRGLGYFESYLAIEPEDVSFARLVALQLKDHNLSCEQYAIGDENRFVNLNVANNNALSSSVLEFGYLHTVAAPEITMVRVQEVPMKTLSFVLEDFSEQNVFLKIDAQGFEYSVLKGIADKDWCRIGGALIECNLINTYLDSGLIEQVLLFMRQKGFVPFRIENGFGQPNFGQQLQVDVLFRRDNGFKK